MSEALRAEGLSVRRGGRALLENVSLSANHGAMLAITGPNGAGKSTLVKALVRLLPHTGTVFVNMTNLDACEPHTDIVARLIIADATPEAGCSNAPNCDAAVDAAVDAAIDAGCPDVADCGIPPIPNVCAAKSCSSIASTAKLSVPLPGPRRSRSATAVTSPVDRVFNCGVYVRRSDHELGSASRLPRQQRCSRRRIGRDQR